MIVATTQEIKKAIQKLAIKLQGVYGQEDVTVICILNGAMFFAVDLMRMLPPRFRIETLRVGSYSGKESTGTLTYLSAIPVVDGKNVILLDEICDSGLTLGKLYEQMKLLGAREVSTAVLVNIKRDDKKHEPTYACLTLPSDCGFLVGYGMDDNGKGRQLDYLITV